MSTEPTRTASDAIEKLRAALRKDPPPPPPPLKPLPSWAPQDLVGSYEMRANRGDSERLLELLASHAAMEAVWASLRRHADNFERLRQKQGRVYQAFGVSLFWECERARIAWRYAPRLTKKEARHRLKKIAQEALDFGKQISEVRDERLDDAVHEAFLENEEALWDFHAGVESAVSQDDFRDLLRDACPSLVRILLTVNDVAQRLATTPVGLEQPNSPMAGPRFLARWLSSYFFRFYGLPLHENVATYR